MRAMISELKIKNDAPYLNLVTITPKQINYFYGSNGSGKTTLTRILKDPLSYSESQLSWDTDTPEEIVVFNRDFISKSFSRDTTEIDGVFTLGEENIAKRAEIDTAQKRVETLNQEIMGQGKRKKSLEEDLAACRKEAEQDSWPIKLKFDAMFPECLVGYKGSKTAFFEHCIQIHKNPFVGAVLTDTELQSQYEKVYKAVMERILDVPLLDCSTLATVESNELLKKRIVNNNDIQLGKLIDKLNSSDWVHSGISYLTEENICPFCQQPIDDTLKHRLLSLFDTAYEADKNNIARLEVDYHQSVNQLLDSLREIIRKPILGFDYTKLQDIYNKLNFLLNQNSEKLRTKVQNPSTIVELEPSDTLVDNANQVLKKLNQEIEAHNKIVNAATQAKKEITDKVWAKIQEETANIYTRYAKKCDGISKGITNIENIIRDKCKEVEELQKTISTIESTISNTTDTINDINSLLQSYGFTGFKLREAPTKGKYVIVRPDNTDAKATLSEGEYNFITFLYFYQLVKGSLSPSGINRHKIVVIDDPISSLDSNILFIITSLVKNIREMCREQKYGITQMFVFSHNIYFYKEITFYSRSEKHADEQHYVIRKTNNISTIEAKKSNPITTSYRMLWEEVKEGDPRTCCNAMRRILEYYFNTIGGQNYETIISKLQGPDLQVGRSLIAFINDNSHFITDDFYFQVDEANIDTYKAVFKKIFGLLNHGSHYDMMMAIES